MKLLLSHIVVINIFEYYRAITKRIIEVLNTLIIGLSLKISLSLCV